MIYQLNAAVSTTEQDTTLLPFFIYHIAYITPVNSPWTFAKMLETSADFYLLGTLKIFCKYFFFFFKYSRFTNSFIFNKIT